MEFHSIDRKIIRLMETTHSLVERKAYWLTRDGEHNTRHGKNETTWFYQFPSALDRRRFLISPLLYYECTRMKQGERGQYFFRDSFRPQKTLILNVEMLDYPVKMNCTLEFHYCNHFFTHRHNAFRTDASLHNNAWFQYFLCFTLRS